MDRRMRVAYRRYGIFRILVALESTDGLAAAKF